MDKKLCRINWGSKANGPTNQNLPVDKFHCLCSLSAQLAGDNDLKEKWIGKKGLEKSQDKGRERGERKQVMGKRGVYSHRS